MKNIILSGIAMLVVLYGGSYLLSLIEIGEWYRKPSLILLGILLVLSAFVFIGFIVQWGEDKCPP